MDEAARADRVVVINDGRLLIDGTAKSVFSEVELLHEIGLEAPQGKELIHSLRKMGYDLDANALSEEECAEEIIRFLKK